MAEKGIFVKQSTSYSDGKACYVMAFAPDCRKKIEATLERLIENPIQKKAKIDNAPVGQDGLVNEAVETVVQNGQALPTGALEEIDAKVDLISHAVLKRIGSKSSPLAKIVLATMSDNLHVTKPAPVSSPNKGTSSSQP